MPGVETDALSIELFEANLDDHPTFDALSYTWNLNTTYDMFHDFDEVEDKGGERPIECNGKTIHATMNLYEALLEFRRQRMLVPVWADQICINQQDNAEKIPQLAIMADIYTSASTVLIWLGTMSMTRNWGVDFMEGLPDHPIKTVKTVKSTAEAPPQRSLLGKINRPLAAAKAASIAVGNHSRWIAAILVLARNWFDRIWTLQEILLAKRFRLLMGGREISQAAFVKAATQLFDFYASDSFSIQIGLVHAVNSDLRSMLQNRAKLFDERDVFQQGKRYTAEEYLIVARRKEATVPKDLIFAGDGLIQQGVPESIDYSSATVDVYSAFAAERLWPHSGLRMLSLVGGTTPKIEGLPTWVPDLGTELIPEPLRHCGCSGLMSPLPVVGGFHIKEKILFGKIAKVGKVQQVGETLWSWTKFEYHAYNTEEGSKARMKTSSTASQERFGMMFGLLDQIGKFYTPSGERSTVVLWKTLLAGAVAADSETTATWQSRFNNFFALRYLDIRSILRPIRESSSLPDPWMVPLVQDLASLEKRVSSFIDTYDADERAGECNPQQSLKETIADLTIRLYDGDKLHGLRAVFKGDPSHEPASFFGDLFTRIYDGRRIFLTSNGYLGITAEAVRPGDEIFLLPGADVPYVFRAVEGKDAKFTLVGEAYVHGLLGQSDLENGYDLHDVQLV
jgi:hypothetical protein